MGKYLDFYIKCGKSTKLPSKKFLRTTINANGLCNDPTVGYDVQEWFAPDAPSCFTEAHNNGYWGTEIKDVNRRNAFCPLRQNIVLFLAAIHGEFDKKKRKRN